MSYNHLAYRGQHDVNALDPTVVDVDYKAEFNIKVGLIHSPASASRFYGYIARKSSRATMGEITEWAKNYDQELEYIQVKGDDDTIRISYFGQKLLTADTIRIRMGQNAELDVELNWRDDLSPNQYWAQLVGISNIAAKMVGGVYKIRINVV